MKKIVLNILEAYQKIVSPSLRILLGVPASCRYETSCSEFSKKVISKYGILKGAKLSLGRILSCQGVIGNGRTFSI